VQALAKYWNNSIPPLLCVALWGAVLELPQCPGCEGPENTNGPPMWRHSLPGLMVAAAFSGQAPSSGAEDKSEIKIITKLVQIPQSEAQNTPWLGTNNAPLFMLKHAEAANMINRLQKRADVVIMTAPPVTTRSGRKAQVQMTAQRSILTPSNGICFTNAVKGSTSAVEIVIGPRSGQTNTCVTTFSTGPNLDFLAEKLANDSIRLAMDFTLVDFLGYGPPKTVAKWNPTLASNIVQNPAAPLPRFRRIMSSHLMTLQTGDTAVCGPLCFEETRIFRKSVPLFSDIPLIGRFYYSTRTATNTVLAYVLLTTELIEPTADLVPRDQIKDRQK
jgi:hypothetical protein